MRHVDQRLARVHSVSSVWTRAPRDDASVEGEHKGTHGGKGGPEVQQHMEAPVLALKGMARPPVLWTKTWLLVRST